MNLLHYFSNCGMLKKIALKTLNTIRLLEALSAEKSLLWIDADCLISSYKFCGARKRSFISYDYRGVTEGIRQRMEFYLNPVGAA